MAFGDTGIIDNFNRTNEGPPLSSSWSEHADYSAGWKVVSNRAEVESGGVWCGNYYNVSTYGPDCEVYATLAVTGSNIAQGVCLRLQSPGSVNHDGYYFESDRWSGVCKYFRIDDSSNTQLGSNVSVSLSSGDKIGGDVNGSTLILYTDTGGGWTARGSRTDSTYSSAGYVALQCYDGNGGVIATFDDFGGGNLSSDLSVSESDGVTIGDTATTRGGDMGIPVTADNADYQYTGVRIING
jgi:hypothetical protein